MNRSLFSFFLLIAVAITAARPAASQIKEAKVTGGIVKGAEASGVAAFKGIPFAAPPVGELRWKAPQPLIPWTGEKSAKSFAPACMQTFGMMFGGAKPKASEDCLYLNVWTGAKNKDEKRPVMVWIYGGGYTGGSTSLPMYDGVKLAEKGIVLVSIAYRLGAFGFLAHPELSQESGKGSGNYALLDMIAGLQWVKDNIAEFGGDPSCVTIFGQSAGGSAVSMLAASPYAKGLFHRVIAESGASFAPPKSGSGREMGQNVPTLVLAESNGKKFLQELGAADIKAARAINADKIQANPAASQMGFFWPVADGDILPGDQYELYLAGRFNDTPILIGFNSDEGAAFARNQSNIGLLMQMLQNNFPQEAEALLSLYPHSTDFEANQSARDVGRDAVFGYNAWSWARLETFKGKNKAFLYYFNYHDPNAPGGASHGAEVNYVFGNFQQGGMRGGGFGNMGGFRGGGGPSAGEKQMLKYISAYWINFARTGDPNGSGLPPWPAFNEQEQKAMVFGVSSFGGQILPNLDIYRVYDKYYARLRALLKNAGAK